MFTDIIFDFFGTLVQYTPGSFHTAPYQQTHTVLLDRGFVIGYDEFEKTYASVMDELETGARQSYREYSMHDTARRFFDVAFGRAVPATTLDAFVTTFLAEWSRGITYYPELGPLLEMLGTRYRLSIVSNTHYPDLVPQNLASMGLAQHFAQVVTSVEVGMRKPDPTIFVQALDRLQIDASQALYVGDTYVDDYQGASAAGIACALIDPNGRYPDVPIRLTSLFDLPALLADT